VLDVSNRLDKPNFTPMKAYMLDRNALSKSIGICDIVFDLADTLEVNIGSNDTSIER
jgi:hypothetical protein